MSMKILKTKKYFVNLDKKNFTYINILRPNSITPLMSENVLILTIHNREMYNLIR